MNMDIMNMVVRCLRRNTFNEKMKKNLAQQQQNNNKNRKNGRGCVGARMDKGTTKREKRKVA